MTPRWEIWCAGAVYWLERAAGRHEVPGFQRRVAVLLTLKDAERTMELFR